MAKLVLSNVKKLLTGEVQDDTCNTHEDLIHKMFGIGETVAEVPDYGDKGEELHPNGVREKVVSRSLIAESIGDFDSIGAEAFGRELMGRDFYSKVDRALSNPQFFPMLKEHITRQKKIGESVQADTASLYEPINAWGSFVLGLYEHKILQGYDSAPRVYEKLMPSVPALIHGAQKHTLHDYDGTLPPYESLVELQEEDTARGVPLWVWSQPVNEAGLQYALTMEALKSDLDGGLGSRGMQIGIAIAKRENYRAGSTFMGYNNKYYINAAQIGGNATCNTFLSSADTGTGYNASNPLTAYENKFYSNPLLTVDSLATAYIRMLQLQAPGTNWRMDVGDKFVLLVSPTMYMRALQIVHSIRDYLANFGGFSPYTSTGSNGATGRVTESENALKLRNLDIEVIDMGQEWQDVLTGGMNAGTSNAATATAGTVTLTSNGPPPTWVDYAGKLANNSNLNPLTQFDDVGPNQLMSKTNTLCGVSTDVSGSADNLWMLISKKHLFAQHELWIPVQPRTFPLSGQDMAKRIAMRGDVIIGSRFVTLEPRAAQINLAHASGVQ